MQDKLPMLSKTALIERGWTEKLVTVFMPEPDELKRNPRFHSAAPMRLYREDRVLSIESGKRFLQESVAAQARRLSALRVAERRRAETLALVDALPVPRLPKFTQEELQNKSIRHYNRLWEERGTDKTADENAPKSFLQRITVNYARHMLTDYEEKLEEFFGKIGADEARANVKCKILSAISAAYSWLVAECQRQATAEDWQ